MNSVLDLSAPFRAQGDHITVALDGARALFTTRRGGSSTGPYAALNMGTTTGPQPPDVVANRRALEDELGVRMACAHQVHGTRVAVASGSAEASETADGQATITPGVAATVMVADCLPIALAGEGGVAMIHAGWRGLAAGIVAAGVGRLRELDVGGPLSAAIGPGAGGCCYEVGDEVRAAFSRHGAAVRHGRNLDLKAIAARELEGAGVEVVHDVGLCTLCSDPSLFFSHRRDRGVTGRQAGLAWLA
ncbi:MAG TPA: polyphenol oxidase family protein [Solirubrobacteraceae bacterium]|nr:polyphenol oxidase family protein [Solirubrobacteraceae bacterium]